MRIGVRLRHFLISLFFIAVSVGAADAYLTHAQAARVTAMISDALFARAKLVARDASSSNADVDDFATWQALAVGAGMAEAGERRQCLSVCLRHRLHHRRLSG